MKLRQAALLNALLLTVCTTLSACGGQATVDENIKSATSRRTWTCSNPYEAQCDSDGCAVASSTAFTPMEVHIQSNGNLSVCAYSGCWEGTSERNSDGDFMIVRAQQMSFSTIPEQPPTDAVLALDIRDHVATIKIASFAHALLCEPTDW